MDGNHPTQPEEVLRKHKRWLQLRNRDRDFRGPLTPGLRNKSAVSLSPPNAVDSFIHPFNDENSPRSERWMPHGKESPLNPRNKLQEVHNSTRQKHASPGLSYGAKIQDKTASKGQTGGENGGIRCDEDHHEGSGCGRNVMPAKISKLRAGSENKGTFPPPSRYPFPSSMKEKQRLPTPEAEKYIDYLERQLSATNRKVESFEAADKARTTEIRILEKNYRNLRQEVSDWEMYFAERVKEEVALEARLRSRVRSLEKALERTDLKMRTRTKQAEELQELKNMSLEKRVGLLAPFQEDGE